MRIRFKPWARPELEASSFYRDNPEELKNKWIEEFKNKNNPIHLELGCGKGQFISQLAVQNSDVNYIAIDLVDAMLGLAKRNVEQIYQENKKEGSTGLGLALVNAVGRYYGLRVAYRFESGRHVFSVAWP